MPSKRVNENGGNHDNAEANRSVAFGLDAGVGHDAPQLGAFVEQPANTDDGVAIARSGR